MFALALTVLVLTVAASGRLIAVVRTDRPLTPPRPHAHDLDPASARFRGSS